MDEKICQTITKDLGDLHALETHGHQAISRQVDDLRGKNHPAALRACESFKQTLESHINSLDARLKALGGSPTTPLKEAVTAAAGFVAGLYGAIRNEAASKMLRDDYTFLSLDAISYLMLHTTALGLGDADTARLCEQGYRDCAGMIIAIDRLMPDLVLDELRQDGFQVADVSAECHRLIAQSWQRGEPSPSAARRAG